MHVFLCRYSMSLVWHIWGFMFFVCHQFQAVVVPAPFECVVVAARATYIVLLSAWPFTMPACKCGTRCPFECVACSTQSALLQWVINNSWQWQPDGCVIWSAFFCVGSRKPACMHQFSVGDSCVARIYICTIQKHVNYTWKQMKINENPWTSMKINENNENLWKSMNVNENQW